jgi:hypothetical protein
VVYSELLKVVICKQDLFSIVLILWALARAELCRRCYESARHSVLLFGTCFHIRETVFSVRACALLPSSGREMQRSDTENGVFKFNSRLTD